MLHNILNDNKHEDELGAYPINNKSSYYQLITSLSSNSLLDKNAKKAGSRASLFCIEEEFTSTNEEIFMSNSSFCIAKKMDNAIIAQEYPSYKSRINKRLGLFLYSQVIQNQNRRFEPYSMNQVPSTNQGSFQGCLNEIVYLINGNKEWDDINSQFFINNFFMHLFKKENFNLLNNISEKNKLSQRDYFLALIVPILAHLKFSHFYREYNFSSNTQESEYQFLAKLKAHFKYFQEMAQTNPALMQEEFEQYSNLENRFSDNKILDLTKVNILTPCVEIESVISSPSFPRRSSLYQMPFSPPAKPIEAWSDPKTTPKKSYCSIM